MKRSHFLIAGIATLIFGGALGHSLFLRAQLSTPGSVCFTLGFINNQRTSTNNLALPVTARVMAGSTQVYSQTVTSDSTGKVTVTLPVSVATSHTVTLTPKGHLPVTFTVTGDLSGTCIAVPAPARAGDVNEDGSITTADLIAIIQAMRGVPSTGVTQTYGVPTIKLAQVVEAVRNMRTAEPGTLTVARGAASSSSSSSSSSAASSAVTVAGELGPYVGIQLPSYGGHPEIPNLVSIQPKIVVSRTSGLTPFMIQVHATETTATFSDGGAAFKAAVGRDFDPYLDLEYKWDFGDGAGTETMQHPVTGQTVNANSDQTGPEAAYVYRNSGNYTVRLTVRGFNGSTYVTANTTTVQVPEIQQFRIDNATSGTYTLSLNGETTAPIAYNATPTDVATAISLLPSVGAGTIQPTHYGMFMEFRGSLFGQDVNQITIDGTGLTTSTTLRAMSRTTQEGTTSTSVTAQAWSGEERYFDPTYDGSNGPSDGTQAKPYTTAAQFTTWIRGVNRKSLLKRGTTLNVGIFHNIMAGGRIDAYGSGPLPILQGKWMSGTSYGSPNIEDVVISNIQLRPPTPTDFALFLYGSTNGDTTKWYNLMRHWTFMDSVMEGQSAVQIANYNSDVGSYFTFWRVASKRDATQGGQGLLINLVKGLAIVGGSFSGGNGHIIFDHHIYPTVYQHSLYRWIDFQKSQSLNFCINTNARGDAKTTDYVLIDGNDITGTQNGWDASNANNNPLQGRFDQMIAQNNAVHVGEIGTQGAGSYSTGLFNTVARDNSFWNNRFQDFVIGDSATHLSLYRNRHYASTLFYWNPVVTPSGYAKGNIFQSRTTQQYLLQSPLTTFQNNWKFYANTYFTPLQIGKVFLNSATNTSLTFAAWQALGFDTNGQYTDPHWNDPANGDFSPR